MSTDRGVRGPATCPPPGVASTNFHSFGSHFSFSVVPIGQVAQVADRHRAGADLHVADRPLARPDAVQPVALVARRLVKVNVLLAERLLDDLPRIAGQVAAVDEDLAVAADEGDAVDLLAGLVFGVWPWITSTPLA